MTPSTTTVEIPDRRRSLLDGPIGLIADLGGIASLATAAAASILRRGPGDARLLPAAFRQARWMLGMGIPLVGLVCMSFGSFLAMQAYFGATFTEAAGAVVGLGLIRNVAPLLTGFVMAGLIAAKVVSDLKGGLRPGLDDPRSLPDRDVVQGLRADDRPSPTRSRVALARVAGAMVAGPLLAAWGTAVGIAMGLLASRSMLGMSPAIFSGKIIEMLEPIDVVGLLLKPAAFAGMAALLASFEGMRSGLRGEPDAFRAALRAVVMTLFLNFTWFNLVYLAGDPFGPSVLTAPAGQGGAG